jgi:hypothetical protein
MPIPPPIDPRQLAAEIEATVSELSRLAMLATSTHVEVKAEIGELPLGGSTTQVAKTRGNALSAHLSAADMQAVGRLPRNDAANPEWPEPCRLAGEV